MHFAQHFIAGATGGLGYDVVDGKGVIVERVQLPKDRTPVGFWPWGHHLHALREDMVGGGY